MQAEVEPEERIEALIKGEQEEQPEVESQPEQEPETPEEIVKYRFSIKDETGNDVEVEMTPEEMQKSVMLEKDYRKKTEDISRQRREESAKADEIRQQYVQGLNLAEQAVRHLVAPEFQGVDMRTLARDDPAKYVELTDRMNQVNQTISLLQQEQQRVMAEEKQRVAVKKAEMWTTLGWSDQQKQAAERAAMSFGFTKDELDGVIDPRSMKVLLELSQYQQMKEGKPLVEKKVAEAPKVLKPQKPVNAKKEDAQLAREQLRKDGSVDAFANFLMKKGLK